MKLPTLPTVKVYPMNSPRTGNPVTNQYHVITDDGVFFQSYDTLIAFIKDDVLYFTSAWNYSRTTTKYLNLWLESNRASNLKYGAKARDLVQQGIVQVI